MIETHDLRLGLVALARTTFDVPLATEMAQAARHHLRDAGYEPGLAQASFDKQYVRDWLLACGWNKEPPAPELPPEVVEGTLARYLEAYRRLTGEDLALPGAASS